MIDTLMMAYTVETVSAEKVMASIRQYSSCNLEVEMPYDTEDAVTTWINKVGYGIFMFVNVGLCRTSLYKNVMTAKLLSQFPNSVAFVSQNVTPGCCVHTTK